MAAQGPSHQPRCAVCVAPIEKKDQFVLSGTEVFHLACVKLKGTAASVGNRRRQKIAALEARVRELELENQTLRQDAQATSDSVRQVTSKLRELGESIKQQSSMSDEYRRQRDESRRERDEATAARDAAKRELALHQQIAGTQATKSPTTPPADPPKTMDEDQAERFRLLELD